MGLQAIGLSAPVRAHLSENRAYRGAKEQSYNKYLKYGLVNNTAADSTTDVIEL